MAGFAPYSVDGDDEVVTLLDVPAFNGGAPIPQIAAAEHELELSFFLDGDTKAERDRYAVVRFSTPRAHYFGPPNEDVRRGHPLYERGLQLEAGYEVKSSSWLRSLEAANRIHPCHSTELFSSVRHFIFVFRDSTFECIAEAYEVEVKDAEP